MQQQMQQGQQQGQQVQPQFTFEGGQLVMFHQEATGLTSKDATVNDRDRMQDLLAQEKYLTTAYNIAMNEASHDALYQVWKQNHDTCQQLERQIFTGMFKKGWYRLPVADAASVTHAFDQFQQYKAQFPFPPGQQAQTARAGQQGNTQMNQVVTQAINQAQQGQVPSYAGARQQAQQPQPTQPMGQTGAGYMAGAANTQADQQLQKQVDQALRQAERGQVPRGYSAPPRRGH